MDNKIEVIGIDHGWSVSRKKESRKKRRKS